MNGFNQLKRCTRRLGSFQADPKLITQIIPRCAALASLPWPGLAPLPGQCSFPSKTAHKIFMVRLELLPYLRNW